MKLLALYWSFMIIAYILAVKLKKRDIDFSWTSKAMMAIVYLLCFDMGLRMGINKEVTSSVGTIGLTAFVITVCCIGGSIAAVTILRKILHMDKHGDSITEKKEETVHSSDDSPEDRIKNLLTTIFIILVVGGGMTIGAFVIAGRYARHLAAFDAVSYYSLIVLLCILLFFVGFDIGSKGSVFDILRKAGFRILAFPIAAIIGTMVVGTIACLVMGFTMRESLAISCGFGWYSYAPIVIAGAGNQFVVASAVSFMHNVMREVSGIIFIPLIARKLGYIESTAVPGSAAMDVCMPIVEHACRPDTAIYSFTTGCVMCIATSIGVPLIMSI